MSISDELRKLGFEFQYEHGDADDRTEVWTNQAAGMAVRIQWLRLDDEPAQGRLD